jgi:hypothetical protein
VQRPLRQDLDFDASASIRSWPTKGKLCLPCALGAGGELGFALVRTAVEDDEQIPAVGPAETATSSAGKPTVGQILWRT